MKPPDPRSSKLTRIDAARSFGWVLRLAVSAGCIGLLLVHFDGTTFVGAWAKVSSAVLVALAAIHVAILLMIALRWHVLVIALGGRPSYRETLGLSFSGTFLNLVLPFNIAGDAMRVMLGRRSGIAGASALASVILDRAIGFAGLGVLVLVSVLLGGAGVPAIVRLPLLCLIAVPALAFLSMPLAARLLAGRSDWAGTIGRACADIQRHKASLLGALTLTVFCHALAALAMTLIANDLGIQITIAQGLFLFPGVLLAGMLPVSFGGWGVREVAAASLLAPFAIGLETAATVSLLFALVQVAIAGLGSALWVAAGRRHAGAGRA